MYELQETDIGPLTRFNAIAVSPYSIPSPENRAISNRGKIGAVRFSELVGLGALSSQFGLTDNYLHFDVRKRRCANHMLQTMLYTASGGGNCI